VVFELLLPPWAPLERTERDKGTPS